MTRQNDRPKRCPAHVRRARCSASSCSLFLPNFRRRSWAISNESFAVGADMGEKHPSITPQDGSHLDTEVNPPHYSAPYDDMD